MLIGTRSFDSPLYLDI